MSSWNTNNEYIAHQTEIFNRMLSYGTIVVLSVSLIKLKNAFQINYTVLFSTPDLLYWTCNAETVQNINTLRVLYALPLEDLRVENRRRKTPSKTIVRRFAPRSAAYRNFSDASVDFCLLWTSINNIIVPMCSHEMMRWGAGVPANSKESNNKCHKP